MIPVIKKKLFEVEKSTREPVFTKSRDCISKEIQTALRTELTKTSDYNLTQNYARNQSDLMGIDQVGTSSEWVPPVLNPPENMS